MEDIIRDMIVSAYERRDYDMAEYAYKIMSTLASTVNAPSNWRTIGEELAAAYQMNDWITENCKLYEF